MKLRSLPLYAIILAAVNLQTNATICEFLFWFPCSILLLKIAWRLVLKVRDVIKIVEADGWYHIKTVGDHRHYKHPTKTTKVTIAGHPSDEMKPKTYARVLEQAQIDRKQIRRKR